jgi:hypothetical protein
MDWPQLLPTIAASIRFSVVSSTGVSPFYTLYGVAPRMSFEWDCFHPDNECPPKQLEIALKYADKLEVMRKILQQNVRDCHEVTERKYNKTARPQEFKEGLRVYLKVDHHQPGISPKHAHVYSGPFQILEMKNGVLAKLQNLYTSRYIKNWINVSKLRKVSDNRDILHRRFQRIQNTQHINDETQQAELADVEIGDQPTSGQRDAHTSVAAEHRRDDDSSHARTCAEDLLQTHAASSHAGQPTSTSFNKQHATRQSESLQHMPDVTSKSARADSFKTYRVHKTVELRRSPETENDINKRSSLSSRKLLVQRHMPADTDYTIN